MTSLLQKINELVIRMDGLESSNLQTQITTNSNDISTLQIDKQDILTAGDNISIVGNTISSSGGGSVTQADLDLKQNVIPSPYRKWYHKSYYIIVWVLRMLRIIIVYSIFIGIIVFIT